MLHVLGLLVFSIGIQAFAATEKNVTVSVIPQRNGVVQLRASELNGWLIPANLEVANAIEALPTKDGSFQCDAIFSLVTAGVEPGNFTPYTFMLYSLKNCR